MEREPIRWKDDGKTGNNPAPDWWDESRVDEVAGRLIYSPPGTETARELIETEARLVEIAGLMGVSDEDLAAGLRALEAWAARRRIGPPAPQPWAPSDSGGAPAPPDEKGPRAAPRYGV